MNLLFFILGILFVNFINPVIEELCNLFLTIIETKKGEYAIKIADYNKKVLEIKGEDEEKEPLHVMGFQWTPEDEDDEEEYEEDD